jgi:hypothetical protein
MSTATQIELFPSREMVTRGHRSVENAGRHNRLNSGVFSYRHIGAPIPISASTRRMTSRVPVALALSAAGIGLAAIGASATISYSVETAGRLMGALAATADFMALILPTAACTLWRARRRMLAMVAWALSVAAVGITTMNVAGFVGQRADLFLGGRELASTERALVLERLGRLRAERATISETRPVAAIVLAIRNATRADIDNQRAALIAARQRDEIDRDLAELEPKIASLPAVTMIDPSAGVLAEILRLPADIDLRRIRLALFLVLPLCSGLMLALALAVGTSERAP